MPSHTSAVLTVIIFLATLILILMRPRGLNEAWAAVIGGGLMLGLRLETWREAWSTIAQGADVLLFLLALMLLSALLDSSGFFEWAAVRAAMAARGSVRRLMRNVFLLGAAVTAFLSLDTTAIILTPIVMAFVGRLGLRARPFLIACAMVANTGSLLLPVSNLTNLLFQSRLHFNFLTYTGRMLLSELVAVAVNYGVIAWLFRGDLVDGFDTETLPDPQTVVNDLVYFRVAVAALFGILIGYFAGSALGIEPYMIAFAGCAVLLGVGFVRKRVRARALFDEISWPLFPFVAGLFVIIRAVENLGLSPLAAHILARTGGSEGAQILTAAFGAGIGANIVNNIPMALLSLSILGQQGNPPGAVYGALLGCNIGPNLTIVGSLATMLVITSARRRGQDLKGAEFFRAGSIATPIILLASSLALWLSLRSV